MKGAHQRGVRDGKAFIASDPIVNILNRSNPITLSQLSKRRRGKLPLLPVVRFTASSNASRLYPDDHERMVAYWTGFILAWMDFNAKTHLYNDNGTMNPQPLPLKWERNEASHVF